MLYKYTSLPVWYDLVRKLWRIVLSHPKLDSPYPAIPIVLGKHQTASATVEVSLDHYTVQTFLPDATTQL